MRPRVHLQLVGHVLQNVALALSRTSLPAYSDPPRRPAPRQRPARASALFGFHGESPQRMSLAGPAGGAFGFFPLQITADEADCTRARAHSAEIEFKRPGTVQGSQRGDAIAQTGEQDAELRRCRNVA